MERPGQHEIGADDSGNLSEDAWVADLVRYLTEGLRLRSEARRKGLPCDKDDIRRILADVESDHQEIRAKFLRHGIDIDAISQAIVVAGLPTGIYATMLPGTEPGDPFCVCVASRLLGNIVVSDINQAAVAGVCLTCKATFRALAYLDAGKLLGRNTVVEVVCQRQHRLARMLRLGRDDVILGSTKKTRMEETVFWTNGPLSPLCPALEYSCRCGTALMQASLFDGWASSGRRRVAWATIDQIGQQRRSQLALNKPFTEQDVADIYSLLLEILVEVGLSEEQLSRVPQLVREVFAPHTWSAAPPKREPERRGNM